MIHALEKFTAPKWGSRKFNNAKQLMSSVPHTHVKRKGYGRKTIQGRKTRVWAWWVWREDLLKEAGNEQVTEGETASGSFSGGTQYEERGGGALFVTAVRVTNSNR